MEPLNQIVERVLQSPQLRSALENTVRDINSSQRSEEQPQRTQCRLSAELNNSNTVTQELHRLFPSIRGTSNPDRRSVPRATPKRRKSKPEAKTFFYKEINLLDSPDVVATLTGLKKSRAFENGFAFSNAQFNTNWSKEEIYNYIGDLFKPNLQGVTFELMIPINRRLVKVSLPPGEQLTGKSLKAIFQQKVIYVRPSQPLVTTLNINVSDEESETILANIEECPCPIDVITETDDTNININRDESNVFAIDEQFENDTQIAMRQSLSTTEEISLKDLLANLKMKITDNIISQFNIYREDIFNCCIRAMRRKTFCAFNRISVKFSDIEGNSEGAVDVGGPTREMFRLVINYIKNSKLFFGEEKKYISLNRDAIKNREYFEAGRLIALSLIHGGPGPNFFSEKLYSIIAFGFPETLLTIDEVEPEIKEKILKLKELDDLNLLTDYINQESIFSIAGCHFINTVEEKDKLFGDLLEFYAYHRVRPALEQLKEGLKTGEIYDLMIRHPAIFKDIMCADSILITASLLENLFDVGFGEAGSSRRISENRIIAFWRDLLIETEENDMAITLKDILVFATGADTIPPLGFDNTPKITFLHDDSLYPTANTCGLELRLPTIHKSYNEFVYYVSFGISNCNDFAFA